MAEEGGNVVNLGAPENGVDESDDDSADYVKEK